MNDSNPVPAPNMYDNRLEITSPGKLPMGQTIERMKEGYSKIRNEALAHAFAYMNLIEHWGSGIPRIIDKVKAAGLREPEFIGGEVDLRINIYRGQVDTNDATINANDAKNDIGGVENGVSNAGNGVNRNESGTNGGKVPLNKEQDTVRKPVADYREKSICNTGILCGKNGYIEKNGFSNVRFFTGKR